MQAMIVAMTISLSAVGCHHKSACHQGRGHGCYGGGYQSGCYSSSYGGCYSGASYGCYSQGYAGGYAASGLCAGVLPDHDSFRPGDELFTGLLRVPDSVDELCAGLRFAGPDDVHAGVRDDRALDLLFRLRTFGNGNGCRRYDGPRDACGGDYAGPPRPRGFERGVWRGHGC